MPSASSINKILIFLLLAGIGAGCGDKTNQPVSHRPHKEVPEEGDSITAYLSEAGMEMGSLQAKVKGKLTAPYMLHYQRVDSPYFEFPRTLHADFFKDSVAINVTPVIESRLDSRYGKYLPNQQKVYLRDSVVVKNILKGDTLHCRYLWWDQQYQKFFTNDSVQINTPDKILYGTGMEADQNFRWYTIRKMTGIVLTAGNNIPK
jgi:LPS export ABC transporter protein LptC